MVKTKKLQKNLGKGLLAGALEKPEVPDTIKFKKHFKKLVSVALSAVMVMGMSVTAFAAEPQTSEIEKTISANGYDFTVTEHTAPDYSVSRTYTKSMMTRSATTEDETRAMLLALGMNEDEINAIPADTLQDFANGKEVTVVTSYTKRNETANTTVGLPEETALTSAAALSEEQENYILENQQGIATCGEKPNNSTTAGVFEDSYMKITHSAINQGNGSYKFTVNATWLTMPFFRGYDSIGSCAMNGTVTPNTSSGKYWYTTKTYYLGKVTSTPSGNPLEDAFEGVTHSICTLEFEDHRPLYDWVVNECEFENPPKQIEFAKLYLTNVVTGKRYIKKLVEDGIVDGWDDPRLVSLSALRRRGYTPESIKKFMELVGVAKSHSSVDSAMLEYCIRDDLKLKRPRMAAILDPIKLVITNYPEGEGELVDVPNNQENEEMGTRQVPFSRELYIEREDFKIEKPKKYRRLYVGNEVRLMNAYFVTCTGYDVDEDGNVTCVYATYDPESRGGNSPDGRKVRGTIHWVSVPTAKKAEIRLYENIVDEEKGVYNEDGSINVNPNSLTVIKEAYVEPELEKYDKEDSFQFMRTGYFCLDSKDSTKEHMVFNRIVSLKSSYKPN